MRRYHQRRQHTEPGILTSPSHRLLSGDYVPHSGGGRVLPPWAAGCCVLHRAGQLSLCGKSAQERCGAAATGPGIRQLTDAVAVTIPYYEGAVTETTARPRPSASPRAFYAVIGALSMLIDVATCS